MKKWKKGKNKGKEVNMGREKMERIYGEWRNGERYGWFERKDIYGKKNWREWEGRLDGKGFDNWKKEYGSRKKGKIIK